VIGVRKRKAWHVRCVVCDAESDAMGKRRGRRKMKALPRKKEGGITQRREEADCEEHKRRKVLVFVWAFYMWRHPLPYLSSSSFSLSLLK